MNDVDDVFVLAHVKYIPNTGSFFETQSMSRPGLHIIHPIAVHSTAKQTGGEGIGTLKRRSNRSMVKQFQ